MGSIYMNHNGRGTPHPYRTNDSICHFVHFCHFIVNLLEILAEK